MTPGPVDRAFLLAGGDSSTMVSAECGLFSEAAELRQSQSLSPGVERVISRGLIDRWGKVAAMTQDQHHAFRPPCRFG
jgi:hypothetical protein